MTKKTRRKIDAAVKATIAAAAYPPVRDRRLDRDGAS
jgi:hypothetical protein